MNTVRVRNMELGDGIPKICVPVIAHTYEELVRALDAVKKTSFDLVEFRADFYFQEEAPALEAVRKAVSEKPVLYTIRTKEEGGEIEISDQDYRKRNLQAARFADLVDLQHGRLHAGGHTLLTGRNLIAELHEAGMKVILSWHDFERTPEKKEIVRKMTAMQETDCDITKVAFMPRSRQDVCELLSASVRMLEEKADRPFITMSMGSIGRLSRVACAFTGSCISFGTAEGASAPGQISADRLRGLFGELQAL